MDVEACYAKMNADYRAAIGLLQSDERIIKYFKIIQRDTNLEDIYKALEQNDYETAFRAAHTLKGLALNMHFTQLAQNAADLTETLRSRGENERIFPLLEKTKQTHQMVIACIASFQEHLVRSSQYENSK